MGILPDKQMFEAILVCNTKDTVEFLKSKGVSQKLVSRLTPNTYIQRYLLHKLNYTP